MRNERRRAHTPPRFTPFCCAPSQAPVRGRTSSEGQTQVLRGYSSAAGLHVQRKGHPIGRYKHSPLPSADCVRGSRYWLPPLRWSKSSATSQQVPPRPKAADDSATAACKPARRRRAGRRRRILWLEAKEYLYNFHVGFKTRLAPVLLRMFLLTK